jgi:hypothetical protein
MSVLSLLLLVACHPEGCYSTSSFGYNTDGVVISNLVGVYTFNTNQARTLTYLGYTNHSGYVELRADMTFVCTNIPRVMGIPQSGEYLWSTGKWRVVKVGIWNVEIYDLNFDGMDGYSSLDWPVIGDAPPHGLELTINHDEGYWIRLERTELSDALP